jgi:hypothetical protein
LRRTLRNITGLGGKQVYETQGLAIVSTMAIAAINPQEGDYTNSTSVQVVIDDIKEAHAQLMTDLDSIQSANGGSPTSYAPSFTAVTIFNDLISLTLSNLLSIALNGKREITVILTEDSNITLLTHKYYGLDPDDANIQSFVNNNGFTYKDTLTIKKGREISYYV